MDVSGLETSSSDNGVLFDRDVLEVDTKEQSLSVLANCVYLVNATILRERNLLPAKLFNRYNVYGSVYGYTVNHKEPDGPKLGLKLGACHTAILDQRIHKLAIVAEETLNSDVAETFVWTFSYDSSMAARAHITTGNKHTAAFNVDARNMEETCQQFCKVFSDLQEILNHLQPMPPGMIPSLRVAFRGDERQPDGFHATDTFVNVAELSDVGRVSFPKKMKFHLQYHSLFQPGRARDYTPAAINYSQEDEMSEERIEGPRDETMGHNDMDDDFDYPNVAPASDEINDQVPDASLQNNTPESRIEEERQLRSALTTAEDPNVTLENQIDLASARKKSSKKRGSRSSKSPAPEIEPITEQAPTKKKSARRRLVVAPEASDIISTIADQVQEAAPTRKDNNIEAADGQKDYPQQKETDQIEPIDVDFIQEEQQLDEERETASMDVDEVNQEEKRASNSPKKFGRVKSVLDTDETKGGQDVARAVSSDGVADKEKTIPARFGSTYNFADNSVMRTEKTTFDVQAVPATNPVQRFGRVADLLGSTPSNVAPPRKQSRRISPRSPSKRKFGRVASILELSQENAVIETRRISPRSASKKKFGRVASILELSQENAVIETAPLKKIGENQHEKRGQSGQDDSGVIQANRYGRVSSLTSRAKKQAKYGHSPAIRSK